MNHTGLADIWGLSVILVMLLLLVRTFLLSAPGYINVYEQTGLSRIHWLNELVRLLTRRWVLFSIKVLFAAFFLLIIAAGLFGTPIPERNIATVATWTYWWTGIIISVFFLGSAWCAVCPWDSIATWLTRRKIWGRSADNTSLNLRVPRVFKKIWPAVFLFIFLTWLELGVGITIDPYATAVLALAVVVATTISLAVYERKAFCQYACPVGRTVGVYSQMAALAVGPVDQDICASCKTLECYHGNKDFEPCPTNLVIGKSRQSAYCTSCGACIQSCPHKNVTWKLYALGKGVLSDIKVRPDEAWFVLILLTLTVFHGLTMLQAWEDAVYLLARWINDSGQLLTSFSILLGLTIVIPAVVYGLTILILKKSLNAGVSYSRLFSSYALSLLPLAFAYHIAHNLSHLFREGKGIINILKNPFGFNTLPMTMAEKHERHMTLAVPEPLIFSLQAGIMIFGFWLALKVIVQRGQYTSTAPGEMKNWQLLPVFLFVFMVNGFNLWLLMQPMAMRM